jgi:beta-lactamase class A
VGGAAGCGGSSSSGDEQKLGRDTTGPRQEQRIKALERRAAQLRRRNRAARGTSGAGGPGLDGFDALARSLPGEVGVAVGPAGKGGASKAGGLQSGSAWSTIKVPIALALLKKVGGPDRLDSGQRSAMERALTASDNAAAEQLFGDIGGSSEATAKVQEVLRQAGDDSTQVSTQGRDGFSPYGQTEWPLAAQERFMAAVAGGCIADAASRGYVLGLMAKVTSDRWGLGEAGMPARWKGGWGPGTDGKYLARQMGVIDANGRQLVVTIAARASDGQFASAQQMASKVAAWLGRRARRLASAPTGC